MHSLRRPTEIIRITCVQELREVLGVEQGAPATAVRRVQIVTDPGAQLHFTIGEPTPEMIALAREHFVPPIFGNTFPFHILAGQRLFGMTRQSTGYGLASLIVEYVE